MLIKAAVSSLVSNTESVIGVNRATDEEGIDVISETLPKETDESTDQKSEPLTSYLLCRSERMSCFFTKRKVRLCLQSSALFNNTIDSSTHCIANARSFPKHDRKCMVHVRHSINLRTRTAVRIKSKAVAETSHTIQEIVSRCENLDGFSEIPPLMISRMKNMAVLNPPAAANSKTSIEESSHSLWDVMA